MKRSAILAALLLVACGNPKPAPRPVVKKPIAKKPVAKKRMTLEEARKKPKIENPLVLTEELAAADAFVFVLTSRAVNVERGKGRYAERMTIGASVDEVVFAKPALKKDSPLVVEVPYREIMERMGGTPNTRRTGLTKPNAHPSLPMGWILKREGESWSARAAVRALESDRIGLRQLSEAARGDPSASALLARMVKLTSSGSSGVGRALGLSLSKRVEGWTQAQLTELVAPHVDKAAAALEPKSWPDLNVFLLRHAPEDARRKAVAGLLRKYDAEVARRPPPKKGQADADGALIDGSTQVVVKDLMDPSSRRTLYPLDERDFARGSTMDPEVLAAARAFAKGPPATP